MRKSIRAAGKRTAALLFAFALIQAMPVYAQSSEFSVKTTVPETHSAVLLIAGEGTVAVNGKDYTAQNQEMELQIPRLEEVEWTFIPADGYAVKSVLYNGADVTAELTGQTYTAAPVNEDGTRVEVAFVKGQDGSGADNGQQGTGSGTGTAGGQQSGSSSNKTGNVQTGDDSPIPMWMAALFTSLIVSVGIGLQLRRNKKCL